MSERLTELNRRWFHERNPAVIAEYQDLCFEREAQLAARDARIAELEGDLAKEDDRLAASVALHEDLRNKLSEVEHAESEATEQLALHEQSLREQATRIAELEAAVGGVTLKHNNEHLQALLDQLTGRIADINARAEKAESHLADELRNFAWERQQRENAERVLATERDDARRELVVQTTAVIESLVEHVDHTPAWRAEADTRWGPGTGARLFPEETHE